MVPKYIPYDKMAFSNDRHNNHFTATFHIFPAMTAKNRETLQPFYKITEQVNHASPAALLCDLQ